MNQPPIINGRTSTAQAETVARELLSATQSGVELSAALRAAAAGAGEQTPFRALQAVAQRCERGEPLAQILEQNSPLPPHLSGLIRAALQTGQPVSAIAEWLFARDRARSHWWSVVVALQYPLFAIAMTYGVFLFCTLWLTPLLRDALEGFGIKLHASATVVFWLSDYGAPATLWVLSVTALVLAGVRIFGGRSGWSRLMRGLPLIGPLWHWSGSSELLRGLAILLDHRLPLPQALDLTGQGIADAALGQHCQKLGQRVAQGATLGRASQAAPELPASIYPLLRSGERAGTLPDSLRLAATMLEGRLEAQSTLILQLVPPIVFVSIGTLIVLILAAFMFPMIDLLSWFGGGLGGPTTAPVIDPRGPLALLTLVIPSLALLLALRIFYRGKPLPGANQAHLALLLTVWMFLRVALIGVLVGSLWMLAAVVIPVVEVTLMMLADRFRRAEHQALLQTLGFAEEVNVPLSETARAFAQEQTGDTGLRALRLAEQLEAGTTLSAAVRYVRLRISTPLRLAVNLSDVLSARGLALRTQLNWGQDADLAVRGIFNRLFYLALLATWFQLFTWFALGVTIPRHQRIYDEFGLRLPRLTQALIDLMEFYQRGGWGLVLIALLFSVLAIGIGFVFYCGWYDSPVFPWSEAQPMNADKPDIVRLGDLFLGLRWLFWRYDASFVLRGLALLLQRNMPLPEALALLANVYPRGSVRRRLTIAALAVERGGDWKQALRDAWLLGNSEAAVLGAAERAGNLPWALDEMGESLLRRLAYRLTLVHQIVYPIVLLVFAALTAVIAVGMMLPLISLIQGLA